MPEVSIAISAEDRYSTAITKMSMVTRSFNKDAEHMEQVLHSLNTQKASLKIDGEKAEAELKALEKQFSLTNDEATGLKMQMAQANYDNIQRNLNLVTRGATEAERQMQKTGDVFRKVGNQGASGSGGIGNLVNSLASSGAGDIIKNVLGNAANTAAASLLGNNGANIFSNALSTAVSGAAIGSMILGPGIGTAAGAAVGAGIGSVVGGVNGLIQNFGEKDDAFKVYVQEQVQAVKEQRATELTSGSTIAGGRESTGMAFNKLLGDAETAGEYLKEVQRLAVDTNYTYDEIIGYTKELLNSFQSGAVLDILEELSDATAGLSLNSADVDMFVAGLNRMTTTGKATREYLNYFDDRGLDTSAALSAYLKKDKSAISGLVTGGKVTGQQAVEAIREYIRTQYGGSSVDLASTYDAMVDNLGETMDNINAALGDTYNETSKKGIGEDLEAYGGALGEAMEAMNGIIGEGKGIAQNLDRRYEREAMSALVLGEQTTVYKEKQAAELKGMHGEYTSLAEQYQTATDEDKAVIAAQIEGLKSEAASMAESAYNASDVAVGIKDVGLDLIEAIRDNTAALGIDAYGADYQEGQEQSKGLAAAAASRTARAAESNDYSSLEYHYDREDVAAGMDEGYKSMEFRPSDAFGLKRVPRDNFPALLHEGERVLTADQARTMDRQAGTVVVDKLADTLVIREESDIEKIAAALARKLQRSSGLAVPV